MMRVGDDVTSGVEGVVIGQLEPVAVTLKVGQLVNDRANCSSSTSLQSTSSTIQYGALTVGVIEASGI